ncbi:MULTISPECIES: hypothetical protein [Bizionia]|uniref:Uncharacterized protein n=1 Tax=Bizionia algoritergicola TaxID=291187 RepID=A0A5D0QXK3_9FLAO|nr:MULTISPECIES: hypothetical protein [Bizionia]OBX24006.1 hypothetical protein BAA08_01310 [Bizionia sp. APA-3]TYB73515.1 hypothetical protein ES675_07620 [Bizionia algoritergicola]
MKEKIFSIKVLRFVPIILVILGYILTKQLDIFTSEQDIYVLILVNAIAFISLFFLYKNKVNKISAQRIAVLGIAIVASIILYFMYLP